MEFILMLTSSAITGVIFHLVYTQPDSQIDNFKNPTCIEKQVGKDLIKKCYAITEVNSEKQ